MSVRPNKPGCHLTSREAIPEMTAAITMKSQRFIDLCKEHDVKPTKRQAAAFNARRGRWENTV